MNGGTNHPAPSPLHGWLESAADLLVEPDPGPTPYLVDRLIADQAIAVIQGSPKVGKTWVVLDLARAIATGQPALGHFEIPERGPVIVILEESGRTALHRRLDALARGHQHPPDALHDLHFAANRRIRLDDHEWRNNVLDAAAALRPRAVFLDPLVRLKGAGTDEDSQKEMAPVLDYMRDLRDATGAAVIFTHHTGHAGGRLRGTSDLEAYWESKIAISRDGGVCELASEHREAEPHDAVRYRLDWHETSRTIKLALLDPPERRNTLREELILRLAEHPGEPTDAIAKALGRRRQDTASGLRDGEAAGLFIRRPSHYTDGAGRRRQRDGWYPAPAQETLPVPKGRTGRDGQAGEALTVRRPAEGATPLGGAPRDGEPGLGPAGADDATAADELHASLTAKYGPDLARGLK